MRYTSPKAEAGHLTCPATIRDTAKGTPPHRRDTSQAFRLRNVELDELYSFAGAKRPDAQESNLEEVGQHWTHCAMARESRLLL